MEAKQVLLVNLNSQPIGHCKVPPNIHIVKLGDGFFFRTNLLSQLRQFKGQEIFLQSPVLLPTIFTPLRTLPTVVK